MTRIPEEDLQHILTHTRELWESLRSKSVFLTGGTGFFGKWLLESFVYVNNELRLNAHISVLSRNPETFLEKYPFYRNEGAVDFMKGDISDFNFPKGAFQFIIHAATDSDAAKNVSEPLAMLDTITAGTRRVLDFAKEQSSVESFLFTSSGAVYGKQPEEISHVAEDDSFPLDIHFSPGAAYATGKRLAEMYCSIYYQNYKVPVKIARCFAFVGPYLPLDKHFAVGNFILSALTGNDIFIKSDGSPFRSYLYTADLAIWLWTILFKGKNNTPYNVGSEEDMNIRAVAELARELNPSINIIVSQETDGSKPIERYVPNVDLAKKELGLQVNFKLRDSLLKTKKFYELIQYSSELSGL